jgi:hypothetical protein
MHRLKPEVLFISSLFNPEFTSWPLATFVFDAAAPGMSSQQQLSHDDCTRRFTYCEEDSLATACNDVLVIHDAACTVHSSCRTH